MENRFIHKLEKVQRSLSQTQIIAIGFMSIILLGTFLLMLPVSSREGEVGNVLHCFFTAVSATCVTGLVVYDTWLHWSIFGQLVIIVMIQIGGLGFVTIGIFLSMILHRKIGLKVRGLMQESVSMPKLGGMVKLAKRIVLGSLLIEGVGGVILSIRFVPEYGIVRGIYYGFFHSVSAFCNAGFDLMGHQGAYSSLVNYYDDWIVNLVIMGLIMVGGIGFLVWSDVIDHGLKFRKYLLHTKIVLIVSTILLLGGSGLFYLFERNNLLADMSISGKILTSLFNAVTTRTAGFNTVDMAALTEASKLLDTVLMFIGGGPGSTAGGIKVTTVAVMYLSVWSTIRGTAAVNVLGRRLDDNAFRRAGAVFMINITLALGAAFLILSMHSFEMPDVFLETFSAISTVGISTGITRDMNVAEEVILALLMYLGRVGSMSFALALMQSKQVVHVKQPVEQISIG